MSPTLSQAVTKRPKCQETLILPRRLLRYRRPSIHRRADRRRLPNEAFEALIDLLTSDGIDDTPPSTSSVLWVRVTAEGAALRDESGRLDFEKMCSMFEGQNHTESQGRTAAAAGESDRRVLDSFRGGAQTDVVDQRDIPVEDTSYSESQSRYFHHTRFTTRQKCLDGAVPSNDAPSPPLSDVLTTPFSFDQLNDALGSAPHETHTLGQQYDELQQLVAMRLGKGKELKGSKCKTTQKVVCGAPRF